MLKSIQKTVREKDLFGYLITLNFNKRGQQHKTLFGGTVSVAIKMFINVYIVLNLVTLLTYGNNKNNTLYGFEKVMDLGTVYTNTTGTTVYYVMRN